MKPTFWFVWNPEGRNPTHPHGSKDDAVQEAKRLAAANPLQSFIVLKAVSGFRADLPKVEKLTSEKMVSVARDGQDLIPF